VEVNQPLDREDEQEESKSKEDPHDPAALGEKLRLSGKSFEIVSYPAAGHGFFNDARDSYRASSAVDAWQRTLAFLDRQLLADGPGGRSPGTMRA